MTDNEIIKALECCHADRYSCDKCPYGGIKCTLYDDTVDLINRQKEKIERLETMNSELRTGLKVIKRTEIKKFAEKLKKMFSFYYQNVENISVGSVKNHIDKFVKEWWVIE